ncbi:MAG: RNA polymerase sigma factor [Gemmataceae bacterium]
MGERDLRHLSTKWSAVAEPDRFVMRYAGAIRQYVLALVGDPHDADDVCQDFLLRVKQKGFPPLDPGRGRFRHYLIAVVRNAAWAYLGKKHARPGAELHDGLSDGSDEAAEVKYHAEWQRCVLDAAMQELARHERRSPGNLGHTVLRLVIDHPDASSDELAEIASKKAGQTLNAAALRKQLSRARERFAALLAEEVARTLDDPTPEDVDGELAELGLMPYVERYRGA